MLLAWASLSLLSGSASEAKPSARVELDSWKAAVVSCEMGATGARLYRISLEGKISNRAERNVIVPRVMLVSDFDVSLDFRGTGPPHVDRRVRAHSLGLRSMTIPSVPRSADFFILRIGGSRPLRAELFLALERMVSTVHIRAAVAWSAGAGLGFADAEMAQMWRPWGDLVFRDEETPWLEVGGASLANCKAANRSSLGQQDSTG